MHRSIAQALLVAACVGAAMCSKPADQTTTPVASQQTPTLGSGVQPEPQGGGTLAPPNEAFKEFHDQLQQYLAIRAKVEDTIPRLGDTKDPRKIEDRATRLGQGIQEARKAARQGEIFTPRVTVEIRKMLAADSASRTQKEKADIMDEVPEITPVVNGFYPTDSPKGPTALASFPPKLLALLPELPDTIEYRYLGNALVLRDAVANIIVDFLPKATPAAAGKGGEK